MARENKMAEETFSPKIAEEALLKKRKFRPAKDQDLYDSPESQIVEPTSATTGNSRAAKAAASSASSGGSTSDIASSALIGSGDPYAMTAGVGLAVLSANAKKKQEQENARANAENERTANMQKTLANLQAMAQGLRRL